MNKCFKCYKLFPNIDLLCDHIKNEHNLCGKNDFVCMRCGFTFGDFCGFKKHLGTCKRVPLEYLQHDAESEENQLMAEFQAALKREALTMILEIMANMNFARRVGFDMISIFRRFLNRLVDGLKLLVGPVAGPEKEHIIEDFITAIESSFSGILTEDQLHRTLVKNDLLCSIKKFAIFTENEDVDAEEGEEDDEEEGEYEEDSNGEAFEDDEEKMGFTGIAKYCLSPMHFEIKKFFEMPGVFQKVMQNTENIRRQPRISHFINGELWKEKLKSFGKDDIVIPYHLYMDGVQLNNALGTHTSVGSENFTYYILPTIPIQYQSRLENIFTAAFHSAADIKDHGKEASFNSLIDDLSNLANDGLTLNINGDEVKVYFVLGLILGDNLGQNDIAGLTTSFVSNCCCRYCRIFKIGLQTQFEEDVELVRNRDNYVEDVLMNDVSQTGIKEPSILNRIPLFHVVDSVGCDVTHDLSEGIEHYNLAESILYWIKKKKYFTLAQLNERIQSFDYGENEIGNKPPPIKMKKLKKKKFTMTASEMNCFSRNLGFIIGDLITDPDDIGWELYTKTMRFVELCSLPSYDDEDIEELDYACESMNKVYVEKFKQKMKFKHHVGVHYGRLTRKYGPLSHIKVIRLEGKHRIMKNYTKNTNNRRNVSYSLARKVQYNSALRFWKAEGLQDEITTLKPKTIWLKDQEYFSKLPLSSYQDLLSERECFSTKKVTINGILFTTKLWLPDLFDMSNIRINQIVDILLLTPNELDEIFVVCKTYSASYNEYFGCHSVGSFENEFTLIKVSDFLVDHQCPIMVHEVKDTLMFRCKRF